MFGLIGISKNNIMEISNLVFIWGKNTLPWDIKWSMQELGVNPNVIGPDQ